MPEPLFVSLLKAAEQDWSDNGSSATKSIVESVQARLGVSQSRALFRLVERQSLDAVLWRLFSDTGRPVPYVSEHGRIQLANTWREEMQAICENVATSDSKGSGQLNAVLSGRRIVMDCDVWSRTIAPRKSVGKSGRAAADFVVKSGEYWIVSWEWMKA